jgi:hypothetical protein
MSEIREAAPVYNAETYELPKLTESEAHRIAMRTSIPTIVSELETVLTRPLVAYTVGLKDPKTLSRWSSDPSPKIRQLDVERRLRAAFQIVTMLRPWDDDTVIRAVWVGMNPVLKDGTIADAIREDRTRDAFDAAHDFIAHG